MRFWRDVGEAMDSAFADQWRRDRDAALAWTLHRRAADDLRILFPKAAAAIPGWPT